jgi:hypothetical protein
MRSSGRHLFGRLDGRGHLAQPLGRCIAPQLGELFGFLVRGVCLHRFGEGLELCVELGVIYPEFVQFGEDVLGLVLLAPSGPHDLVSAVDGLEGAGVHDFLFGAFMHGEEPDQVLEGISLVRPFRAGYPREQRLDLVVLIK